MGRRLSWLRSQPHFVILPLLVAVFYLPSANLPFFWDDAANFNWMYRRSLASIWTDATGFPYYRPLTFTVWRGLQLAFGPTSLIPFHLANLISHAASALLVAVLAARFVMPSRRTGSFTPVIAGTLFALFPFSALTVVYVGAAFHLFVTCLALGALLCAVLYRDTGQIRWGTAAILLAALAPFAHEEGVVTGGLVLLATLAVPRPSEGRLTRTELRRAPLVSAVALAANLAFLPWWISVPKTRPETFTWVGWESLRQSAVFFLEGLSFPVQFPARWLMNGLGWSDMLAVTALGLPALALALAALWLPPRAAAPEGTSTDRPRYPRRLATLATGYWLLAAAPSLFALPFPYIVVSPRLQVFASPAAALLWAGVIIVAARAIGQRWPQGARTRVVGRLAQGGLAVACLVAPAAHDARTVRLHQYALRPIATLAEAVRQHPTERQLVINSPNWVALAQADYALGHEGVEIMPSYVPPQLLAWTNTGIIAPLDGVAFPNVFPQLQRLYFDACGPVEDWDSLAALLPDYGRVWLWRYYDDESVLHEAGSVRLDAAAHPAAYVASFDERVWLVEAKARLEGKWARLDLTWHSTGDASEDVFAHVFDCDSKLLGQWDGATVGGGYPLWLWPKGATVHDVRYVPLNSPPAKDCFQAQVGLFSPNDGARTPAFGPSGESLPNDSAIINP